MSTSKLPEGHKPDTINNPDMLRALVDWLLGAPGLRIGTLHRTGVIETILEISHRTRYTGTNPLYWAHELYAHFQPPAGPPQAQAHPTGPAPREDQFQLDLDLIRLVSDLQIQ
jgi:hypothetical protein